MIGQVGYILTSYFDLHIRKTDAYYILEAESNDYIYYRTFPYWTSYGAYSVYRSVIQKLGFVPISYDHYTVSHVKSDARGALYQATQTEVSERTLLSQSFRKSFFSRNASTSCKFPLLTN